MSTALDAKKFPAHLAISSGECHPRRARPPRYDKAKEARIFRSGTFGSPDVDGTTERQSRADFSQNESRDHHEEDRDKVRRPVDVIRRNLSEMTVPYHIAAGPPASSPRKSADLKTP